MEALSYVFVWEAANRRLNILFTGCKTAALLKPLMINTDVELLELKYPRPVVRLS